MPIDKQLRNFNFYILMRGTNCSQDLICDNESDYFLSNHYSKNDS